MANLDYLSLAKANEFVEKSDNKIFESISKNLIIGELTPQEKKYSSTKKPRLISKLLMVASTGIFVLIGVIFLILAMSRSLPSISVVIAVVMLALVFVLASFLYRFYILKILNNIKSKVRFDQEKVYSDFFTIYFDNLSVDGWYRPNTAVNKSAIFSIRPFGIPSDAQITKLLPGVTGEVNGMKYVSAWMNWHWVRRVSNGKTTTTVHYNVPLIAAELFDFNSRYDSFEFSISYPDSKIFNWGKSKLENEKFGKYVYLKNNDEIAVRRLLTPQTQESILAHENESNFGKVEAHIFNKSFYLFKRDDHVTFEADFDFSNERDILIQSIIKDLKADIAHFTSFISNITDYKTLKTG